MSVTSWLFSKHVNVTVFSKSGLVGVILAMCHMPTQAATILSNNAKKTDVVNVQPSASVIQQLPDPLGVSVDVSGVSKDVFAQQNAQYANNQLYVPSITSVDLLRSDGLLPVSNQLDNKTINQTNNQSGNQSGNKISNQTPKQSSYPSSKLSVNPPSSNSLPNAYALVKRLNEQEKLIAEQQRQLEDLTYQYQQDIEQLMARLEYVEQHLDNAATNQAKVIAKTNHTNANNGSSKNKQYKNTGMDISDVSDTGAKRLNADKDNSNLWSKPKDSFISQSSPNQLANQSVSQSTNQSYNRPAQVNKTTPKVTRPINTLSLIDPETAYTQALQFYSRDDVEAAIAQMQAFLMQYPTHQLTPNAVYWLGEFHLKTQPANYKQAKAYFTQVVDAFSDSPNNDKQSKSLFRLVQLSRLTEKNAHEQNKKMQEYLQRLTTQYPHSKESKRALELVNR